MKRLMTIIISAPIRNSRGFCPFLIPWVACKQSIAALNRKYRVCTSHSNDDTLYLYRTIHTPIDACNAMHGYFLCGCALKRTILLLVLDIYVRIVICLRMQADVICRKCKLSCMRAELNANKRWSVNCCLSRLIKLVYILLATIGNHDSYPMHSNHQEPMHLSCLLVI